MNDAEAKVVDQVTDHAARLRIPLTDVIEAIKTVSIKNPVGFDFVCVKGKSRDLLLSIIDSGRFGYDDPSTMFGMLAGCVARRSGFKSSFRQVGPGPSMHIQIGDSICNVHLDSIGIVSASDAARNNLYDFSKIAEHWDRDLRPELGPFKNFDVTVLHGQSDVTGGTQFGLVVSLKRRF